MAEGVLFDIAGKVLEMLGSRAFQEIELAREVKDEIRKLKDTVETINAVLLDAEEQHTKKNLQVQVWLRRLKDVFYDADDLLDDFATELRKQEMISGHKMIKKVRIFFSKSNQLVYGVQMGHKIKTIRERLDAIKNDREFHLDEKPEPEKTEREKTHSFVRAEDVIGRDDDKNAIIQLLLPSNDDENLSVIPIVGIGGLGKTTLAQFIYNDLKIKNHFDLKIWVCVSSDDFNIERIIKMILKSIKDDDEDLEKLELVQLEQRLRQEINEKKYLLVLDDLWDENRENWLKLNTLLKNGIRGSKILVTTRSVHVAKITSKLPPYVLGELTEGKSWSLFTQMAFEHGIEPTESKLVEIGKFIVEKCAGVPLAIRTLGRLLYYNNSEAYWLRFMNDELSKIPQEENDILPKLKISYDHLPSHLKQCFAYCALFPKDFEINKELLIDLWMVQGFLHSSNTDQCLEDVGDEYFMNLVSRSFLQDVKYDEEKNTTCKMHDLMHDLATLVAKTECIQANLDATNVDEGTRHISFDSRFESSWDIPTTLLRVNYIRTLFLLPVHRYHHNDLNKSTCNKILSSFRYLRTLNLSHSLIAKLPNSIGKLKHLRYLDLSHNYTIEKLPNSISKLRNLQILKVVRCHRLRRLPQDIRKMVSLRCLMNDKCFSLKAMPHGLGQMTTLRKLSQFALGKKSWKISELSELNKLNNLKGSLSICELRNATSNAMLANLKAQQHLEELKLLWGKDTWPVHDTGEFDDAVLEGLQPHQNLKQLYIHSFGGLTVPKWLSSLRNLLAIEIINCKKCQHLPALDQLPFLKTLRLKRLNELEYISEIGPDTPSPMSESFFPSLKELYISNCFYLKGWWKRDDDNDDEATAQIIELPSFSCLSILHIEDCRYLTSMPLYPSLEELRLWRTSLQPLQQTMMLMTANVEPSMSSSTFSGPLSNLKSLIIMACDDAVELESLTNEYDKQWEGLTRLSSIEFCLMDELVSLPNGLQHISSLQHLQITSCPNLMDLPEGMKLKHLKIKYCPKLLERYGNNMTVGWPKIAHIPDIQINDQWIQKGGCYQLNSKGCSSTSTATGA